MNKTEFLTKSTEIFASLMNDSILQAHEMGILPKAEASFVPELYRGTEALCERILNEINKTFFEVNPNASQGALMDTVARFCMCAGMGATAHWHLNYEALKAKGIYETLTEPKGLFEMDEYVYELIDMPYHSEACNDLIAVGKILFTTTFSSALQQMEEAFSEIKTYREPFIPFILLHSFVNQYKLGVTIELQRIMCKGNDPAPADVSNEDEEPENLPEYYAKVYNELKNFTNPRIRKVSFEQNAYTAEFVNGAFEILSELHMDSQYTFDVVDYCFKMPDDALMGHILSLLHEMIIYVHTRHTTGTYVPKMKRTFLQRLLHKIPQNVEFEKTEFKDTMLIPKPIYTETSLEPIPDPRNYIRCPFTAKAAWNYFLFHLIYREIIFPVLFTKKDLDSLEYILDGNTFIDCLDELKINKLDFTPQVQLQGHTAIVNAYQCRFEGIEKLCLKLEYEQNTFKEIDFKAETLFTFSHSRLEKNNHTIKHFALF